MEIDFIMHNNNTVNGLYYSAPEYEPTDSSLKQQNNQYRINTVKRVSQVIPGSSSQ